MKKIVFIASLIVLAFSARITTAQWAIMRSDADSLIREGAELIYNVKFDEAEANFRKVQELYPKHPAGYFLDAMVDWWKITLYRDETKYDKNFLKKIDKVINVCDAILDTNQRDITALFFKGGAVGYRGRYYAVRKKWIKAAEDGKAGFDILIDCYGIAPGNHDIMLGTGIYNYFSVAISQQYPVLKSYTLFLPKGDKKLGILQLKSAAQYARYAGTEAEVVLLQVYYSFEKEYFKSLDISEKLFEKYPDNPYFHRYLGRSYVTTGHWDKFEQTWRDILINCINEKHGYDKLTAREGLYYVGMALMRKRDYDMALKYLYKCDEACRYLDDEPSGFMVKTNLKIGQIYDAQGKRDLAIKQYKKVLRWNEYSGSHKEAERYIKSPYGK